MNPSTKFEKFHLSNIIHGHWRLKEWGLSSQELLRLAKEVIELGVTSFDHADIYGDHECEQLFGKALALKKSIRQDIQIITKCGINLVSSKYPERKTKHYDQGYDHIIQSVDNSLKNLQTDYIDLLLLHRPTPFYNPYEIAKAFEKLKESGKVLHFGVSNYTPSQFDLLSKSLSVPLITNQVEISPFCLEHFENGNIDYLLHHRIKPMVWSPLAGGRLFNPSTEHELKVHHTLLEMANELNVENIDTVVYAWLLKHPVGMKPVLGTGNIERIKRCVNATHIEMSLEQWFKIYIATQGSEMP